MKEEKPKPWAVAAIGPSGKNRSFVAEHLADKKLFVDLYAERQDPPKFQWLIENLLPLNYLAVLGGDSKCGKTWFVTALALSIASGEPFMGLNVRQSPVLWCSFEENPVERSLAIRAYEVTGRKMPDQFTFYTTYERIYIDDPYSIEQIYEYAYGLGAGLIVIDPLHAAYGAGSISDGTTARRVLTGIKELCKMDNLSVLVIHHLNKSSGATLTRERMSDSAQILAAASMDILMQVQTPIIRNSPPSLCLVSEGGARGGRIPEVEAIEDKVSSPDACAGEVLADEVARGVGAIIPEPEMGAIEEMVSSPDACAEEVLADEVARGVGAMNPEPEMGATEEKVTSPDACAGEVLADEVARGAGAIEEMVSSPDACAGEVLADEVVRGVGAIIPESPSAPTDSEKTPENQKPKTETRILRLLGRGRGDFANREWLIESPAPMVFNLVESSAAVIGSPLEKAILEALAEAAASVPAIRAKEKELMQKGLPPPPHTFYGSLSARDLAEQTASPIGSVRNLLTKLVGRGEVVIAGEHASARLYALPSA